ncbi:glycoside hydrolase family 16 protein [Agrobacterium tumefaciens]|uniref:glycoside hydrolase family 16 protein n=1 Tax=Agrobacterium tumefaciens TaxID=358 RepID=UPI003BA31A68
MKKARIAILLVSSTFVGISMASAEMASTNAPPNALGSVYSGPLRATTPDQSYARRRPVTEQDREAIARYRSGKLKPLFSTTFASAADLQGWTPKIDDNPAVSSCLRSESITADNGLNLTIKTAPECRTKLSTGQIISDATYQYGYFEASMKIPPIKALDSAFWMITDDRYEIDIVEAFPPNVATSAVHQWRPPAGGTHTMVSSAIKVGADLTQGFHDYGLLWTPTEMIFAIDGEPYVALQTGGVIKGRAPLRLSNALIPWNGKIASNPQGNRTIFRNVRVFSLR